MRRALAIGPIAIVIAAVGLTWLLRSPGVETRLTARVRDALAGRLAAEVRLEAARLRLLPPSIELTGLSVRSRERPGLPPLLEAPRARLRLDPLRLLIGRVRVDQVWLADPRLRLVLEGRTVANLPRADGRRQAGGEGRGEGVPPLAAEGGRLRLESPHGGGIGADLALRRVTVRPGEADRGAEFAVALGEGEIAARGVRQPLTGADAEGRVSREGLELRRLRAQAGDLVAEASGGIESGEDPAIALSGTLQGPLASIARHYAAPGGGRPVPLEGDARATIAASGRLGRPTIEVRLTAEQVRLARARADRVTLDARVTADRTELRAGRVQTGGAPLLIAGSLSHRHPYPFVAALSTEGVSAGDFSSAAGPPPPLSTVPISGQVDIRGVLGAGRPGRSTAAGWRVDARAALRLARPSAQAVPGGERLRALLPAEVAGRVEIDRRFARLHGLTVKGTGGAATGRPLGLAVSGRIGAEAPHRLALEGWADLPALAALEPLLGLGARGWPLEGAALARGALRGPAASPTFTGRAEATGLAIGRYRIARVAGPVTASRRSVSSAGLAVRLGDARGTVKGRVDLPPGGTPVLALQATAPDVAVRDLLRAAGLDVPVEGRGALSVRLSGPATRPAGAVTARLGGARLVARASRARDGRLSGSVSVERLPLDRVGTLAGRALPVSGTAGAKATLSGTWTAPRLAGRVALSGVSYRRLPVGDSRLRVALAWPDLAVRGTLAGGDVRVEGALGLARDRGLAVTAELADADLAPYLPRVAGIRAARATVRGLVRISGTLDDLEATRAEASLSALRLDVGDLRLRNGGDVALAYERRVLSVVSAALEAPPSRVALGGLVDLGAGAVDLEANGEIDLALLRSLTARLRASHGTLRLATRAAGPLAAPRLLGTLRVVDGGFTLPGPGPAVAVEGLTGAVRLDGDRAVLDSVAMRVGGGPARLAGTVDLAGLRPGRFDLSATFEAVRLAVADRLRSTSRGELTLSGPAEEPLLAGRVAVTEAVYRHPPGGGGRFSAETIQSALAALKPSLPTRPGDAARTARVDVGVVADAIRVKAGALDAEVRADLRFLGWLPRPNALGSIEVTSGTFRVEDRTFTVTSGRVDSIDPERLDPSLLLEAETKVREFRVAARFAGTVDRHRIELFSPSHPSLTELDILTLLSRGLTVAELRGFSGGTGLSTGGRRSAAEILGTLSGAAPHQLDREAQRLLGLDALQIDHAPDPPLADASEPAATVGKWINPDTRVSRSTGLGGRGEQATRIERWLSDNAAVIGQGDDEHSVRGGVRFRMRFR